MEHALRRLMFLATNLVTYQKHQDVVNFYETVTKVFQRYPTYNMLAAYVTLSLTPSFYRFFRRAGILPSNTTTYSLAEITNALYMQVGAIPYLGCSNNGTALDEIWYFNHALGTVSTLSG